MSKFPLYDTLVKNLPENDLTDIQKKALAKRVEKLDANGHELMYALIRTYQLENSDNTQFIIPYKGVYIENEIHFDLDELPIVLKHILFKFISLHLDKMKEEK